ncbi:hypothetical protein SLA2020_348640 [Shorea laevis]
MNADPTQSTRQSSPVNKVTVCENSNNRFAVIAALGNEDLKDMTPLMNPANGSDLKNDISGTSEMEVAQPTLTPQLCTASTKTSTRDKGPLQSKSVRKKDKAKNNRLGPQVKLSKQSGLKIVDTQAICQTFFSCFDPLLDLQGAVTLKPVLKSSE